MQIWRQVYPNLGKGNKPAILRQPQDGLIKAKNPMEFRDARGQSIRLAASAELQIVDSVIGPTFEVFGPTFLRIHSSQNIRGGKYRTSCYIENLVGFSTSDVFCQTTDKGIDQLCVLSGGITIYEIDEQGHLFTIIDVPEGKMAVMTVHDSKPMRERYTAELQNISDAIYDRVLKEFLDGRRWL